MGTSPSVLVPVSYAPEGHEGAPPSVFVQVIYSPVAPFTEERPCPGNIRSRRSLRTRGDVTDRPRLVLVGLPGPRPLSHPDNHPSLSLYGPWHGPYKDKLGPLISAESLESTSIEGAL